MTVGGGAVLMLIAAVLHDSRSVPPLVIGACWLATGAVSHWQSARTAHVVEIQDGIVTLRGSRLSVSIPATEITDVVRVRFDAQRISPILIRTKGHGTVRLVPRLNGFVDFIVELRQANPAVRISSL